MIAYESRKLQGADKIYIVHDKEMLAIVHTFKTWRCYLTGADVTVRTDHKSLQYLRAQPNLNPRQIRWLYFLERCIIMKSSHQRAAGLLQPLDPPERPWQHVTMDYVIGLLAVPSGNDAILVVVDRLTKMAHFIACQQKVTAEQTAQLFIANVIRLHGLPTAIISDRGPKLTLNFWRHLWDQFGTKLQFSSAYHSQTDGQTEQVNQTMEQLIRTTCTDPQTWGKSLPLLEFAYNNAPSATTHQSPVFFNYGQDPWYPLHQIPRHPNR
ncbi:hypothetical protein CLOM_g14230 [Closterium sp. NIES-68]|nr:hypothetical protein CLOM_g14230 [Closterium sp. NIES-68]